MVKLLSIHLCFVEASLTVEKADRPVALLPSFHKIYHLQYANFVLQAKNAANEVTEAHKNYCSYAHELNGPTFNSLQEF